MLTSPTLFIYIYIYIYCYHFCSIYSLASLYIRDSSSFRVGPDELIFFFVVVVFSNCCARVRVVNRFFYLIPLDCHGRCRPIHPEFSFLGTTLCISFIAALGLPISPYANTRYQSVINNSRSVGDTEPVVKFKVMCPVASREAVPQDLHPICWINMVRSYGMTVLFDLTILTQHIGYIRVRVTVEPRAVSGLGSRSTLWFTLKAHAKRRCGPCDVFFHSVI